MYNNKDNLSMELVPDINYYLQKYPEIKDNLYNFFFFFKKSSNNYILYINSYK